MFDYEFNKIYLNHSLKIATNYHQTSYTKLADSQTRQTSAKVQIHIRFRKSSIHALYT